MAQITANQLDAGGSPNPIALSFPQGTKRRHIRIWMTDGANTIRTPLDVSSWAAECVLKYRQTSPANGTKVSIVEPLSYPYSEKADETLPVYLGSNATDDQGLVRVTLLDTHWTQPVPFNGGEFGRVPLLVGIISLDRGAQFDSYTFRFTAKIFGGED